MYLLVAQHYQLIPTRNASKWDRTYREVVFETENLAEAAEFVTSQPREQGVDIFLRVDTEEGYPDKALLDAYYNLRKRFV